MGKYFKSASCMPTFRSYPTHLVKFCEKENLFTSLFKKQGCNFFSFTFFFFILKRCNIFDYILLSYTNLQCKFILTFLKRSDIWSILNHRESPYKTIKWESYVKSFILHMILKREVANYCTMWNYIVRPNSSQLSILISIICFDEFPALFGKCLYSRSILCYKFIKKCWKL